VIGASDAGDLQRENNRWLPASGWGSSNGRWFTQRESGVHVELDLAVGQYVRPEERGQAALVLGGECAVPQRRRDAATANVGAALAMFEELDTPLWSARARASLARSHVSAGPAKLLTASEQRVAELVASGMTNREVAAALFISPKTVEAHLTRIYRKLDVRTRAELVRRIDQLDS
jgi:DNA-binding CsgD family transcriptional regulator